MPSAKRAFTLVELLVVIAIIVVLMALIAPALDKAIYQAELTVCAANLHAVGVGGFQYAFENNRRYPYRSTIDYRNAVQSGDHIRPDYLSVRAVGSAGVVDFDDRPQLRDHIPLNAALNCPLSEALDLEVTEPQTQTFIYSNYALWFGFRFGKGPNPERGMRKIGDRFEFEGRKFNTLASDSDSIDTDKWVGTSHPDEAGMLAPEVLRNEMNTGYFVTFSFWTNRDAATRGPVDLNFLFDNGSVERLVALEVDDPRLIEVPDRSSQTGWGNPGRLRWLPEAR